MTANSTRAGSESVANGTSSKDVVVNGKTDVVEPNGTDATEPETKEEAADVKTEEKVPMGSVSTIKNIYKSPKDADGNVRIVLAP